MQIQHQLPPRPSAASRDLVDISTGLNIHHLTTRASTASWDFMDCYLHLLCLSHLNWHQEHLQQVKGHSGQLPTTKAIKGHSGHQLTFKAINIEHLPDINRHQKCMHNKGCHGHLPTSTYLRGNIHWMIYYSIKFKSTKLLFRWKTHGIYPHPHISTKFVLRENTH